MDILTIEKVLYPPHGQHSLKLAPSGLALRNLLTKQITSFDKSDIKCIELWPGTLNYTLRIITNSVHHILNIDEEYLEQIRTLTDKYYNIAVYNKSLEFSNIENGQFVISNYLEYRTKELVFDCSLSNLKNIMATKNEVNLVFDENYYGTEIRFNVTNEELDLIMSRSNLTLEKEIVKFEAVQCTVPRGKNDFIIYNNLMKMVGMTYEHKIMLKSIKHIYFLEKEDKQFYVAIKIEPGIRQGQTEYAFIVLVFNDERKKIELKLSEEDERMFVVEESITGKVKKRVEKSKRTRDVSSSKEEESNDVKSVKKDESDNLNSKGESNDYLSVKRHKDENNNSDIQQINKKSNSDEITHINKNDNSDDITQINKNDNSDEITHINKKENEHMNKKENNTSESDSDLYSYDLQPLFSNTALPLYRTYNGNITTSFLYIIKALSNCKISTTGDFVTLTNQKSLRCTLKAFDGRLYPLKDALFFLPKAILMPIKEIQCVEFMRINISTYVAKTFDMKVVADKSYVFNGLRKEDFGQLERYFSEKGIRTTSEVHYEEESEEEVGSEEEYEEM